MEDICKGDKMRFDAPIAKNNITKLETVAIIFLAKILLGLIGFPLGTRGLEWRNYTL